jgi:Golgi nucleoside diphosphatase
VKSLEAAGRRYKGKLEDPCMPVGLEDHHMRTAPSSRAGKALVLVGTGNYDKCAQALPPLLSQSGIDCGGGNGAPSQPCSMQGTPPFPPGQQVLGFSEFWYSMYDVYGDGGVYNKSVFDRRSREFCRKSWSVLQKVRLNPVVFSHGKKVKCGSSWKIAVRVERRQFSLSFVGPTCLCHRPTLVCFQYLLNPPPFLPDVAGP